jgi:hypothetical protein
VPPASSQAPDRGIGIEQLQRRQFAGDRRIEQRYLLLALGAVGLLRRRLQRLDLRRLALFFLLDVLVDNLAPRLELLLAGAAIAQFIPAAPGPGLRAQGAPLMASAPRRSISRSQLRSVKIVTPNRNTATRIRRPPKALKACSSRRRPPVPTIPPGALGQRSAGTEVQRHDRRARGHHQHQPQYAQG